MMKERAMFASLENIEPGEIHRAFIKAFSDYSVKVDMPFDKFKSFLHCNGYEPSLSAGAFEGGSLCGFVLNGIRSVKGVKIAYDSGTGVIPGMRKQGLTKGMLAYLTPLLKHSGVHRYMLEVIKDNEPALKLYKGMGFAITRELSCLKANKDSLKQLLLPGVICAADVSQLDEGRLSRFWDYRPTWQNTLDFIKAEPERCTAVIAEQDGVITGYGVINAQSGRVYQLAVKKDERGKGLASGMLYALALKASAPDITFLNVDFGCQSMLSFLKQQGFGEYVKQYEMELVIL